MRATERGPKSQRSKSNCPFWSPRNDRHSRANSQFRISMLRRVAPGKTNRSNSKDSKNRQLFNLIAGRGAELLGSLSVRSTISNVESEIEREPKSQLFMRG